MSEQQYKRPESVKLPTVWLRFEGKIPGPDGKLPKFRIEDVTADKIEEIINCADDFMKEEITSVAMKGASSGPVPPGINLKNIWRHLMDQKVSLQCVTDDEKRTLVGFNVNEVVTGPKPTEFGELNKNPGIRFMIAMTKMKNNADIFKRWNVNSYIDALGLFVLPNYRSQGISKYLLEARLPLCRALGIKATANTFSSEVARISATKIGFELLGEISLPQIAKEYDITMNGVSEKDAIKYMGMKVE